MQLVMDEIKFVINYLGLAAYCVYDYQTNYSHTDLITIKLVSRSNYAKIIELSYMNLSIFRRIYSIKEVETSSISLIIEVISYALRQYL